MNARPKAGEDEDDLLKLQTQFLQGSHTTSSGVSIKRPDKREKRESTHAPTRDIVKMDVSEESSCHPIPKKKSRFQKEKEDAEIKPLNASVKKESVEDDDIEEMMNRKDTGMAAVLTSIIERDTRNETISAPFLCGQAFPSVIENDRIGQNFLGPQTGSPQGRKKKKSLFAQHVEAKSAQHFGVPQLETHRKFEISKPYTSNKTEVITDRSHIVSGEGLSASNKDSESKRIHDENIQMLSSMTESEILDEQRKLLESTDPKILEFFKNQKSGQTSDVNVAEIEISGASSSFHKPARKNMESKPAFNLPMKPANEWLNMGVVEKEKMEWMTDLPPPDSLSSQTGKPARFDFDGNVLAIDSDVSVSCGLHHHGEEPERAGYTIQELFTLARSANLQQRILALHTVAKIIQMAKCGALVDKIDKPLLPALLEGGVVVMIRFSLDDSAEGVAFAAIDALHSLLCSPLDQEAVSRTWIHHLGNISPSLIPAKTLQKQAEPKDLDEENQEQETDADVVKRDVIVALVTRMQLLKRFQYVFETMRPQATVVTHMLNILTRISQHSSNMAYEITKHTVLISKIFKEFLPTAWSPQDPNDAISNVYGLPVPSALRLVKCLCQAGRHITATLMANYGLLAILLRYLAVDVGGLHLPSLEASRLQIEAFAVWRVCVTYGYGLQLFFDLYSENVKDISRLQEGWNTTILSTKEEPNSLGKEAHLMCVLERILYIIEKKEATKMELEGHGQQSELLGPSVDWGHVKCLYQPVRTSVSHILKSIGSDYPVKKHNLTLPTACVNFLASFYEMEGRQADIDVISRGEDLECFFQDFLNPFLSSYGFSILTENLCPYSNILSSSKSSLEQTLSSLPSLGVYWTYLHESSMVDKGEEVKELNMPILKDHSPFGFIISLLRLALNICKRHKALIDKIMVPLVNDPNVLLYMRKTCQMSNAAFSSSFWTRMENLLQFLWLKCCLLRPCTDMTLAHRVSLCLLGRLQEGDEYIVHDLFTSTVFSSFFIKEGEEIQLASQALENMNLSENLYLKSATQEEINVSKSQLLREASSCLASIRGHFLMALGGMENTIVQSRNIYNGKATMIKSQMLPSLEEGVMPKDWMYLPLIHVYNKSQQMKNVSTASISSQDIAMVVSVLQWNYMYEVWRPQEIDHVSITTKISRVMCVFLTGNSLFLEKRVQLFLAGLLRQFVCPRLLNALNFEERVPGISSFYDLYQEFLDQYEGVSFGDPVFGLYVLLPLQQKHSSLYRKAVWGERRKLLRTLRVSFHDCLIPVENFLETDEDDVELLQLYLHALITDSVQSVWSPIMFLVAVHHVNRFLFLTFDDGKQVVRDGMWKIVVDNATKMSPVIHYKKFNVKASQGFELYEELPDNRKAVLDLHVGKIAN